ncbi:zf-TFIIB domain-containing protein [Myxosarcina sp. GI1]|uniref:TFIIB-type zinc ribbon-containing protein n=1 Tax=Myxosarcina sp. GI1 TaxID=1541065 RepID=UPI00055A80AA|nr:zf-TFIIB domain-containing protein [Myxosarcina sp. GI1]
MNALECPRCNGLLKTVIYHNVEVDRCARCHGIWFDSLEAETLKTIAGSEILDIGSVNYSAPNDLTSIDIRCPRCEETMIQIVDIDKERLWYEKCPDCQGIWLYAGEFTQFKRNFQSKSIKNLAARLINKLLFWRSP